jgi:hypothetical protein
MIGVSVNIYLGLLILLLAFALSAYGFWNWETARKFSPTTRVNTLWILGLVYFCLLGIQIRSQYRKDHVKSSVASNQPQTSQPRTNSTGSSGPPMGQSTVVVAPGATVKPVGPKVTVAPTVNLPPAKPLATHNPQGSAPPSVQPTYQQKCEGSACAQGPNSSATYNKYGAPKPPPPFTVLTVDALSPIPQPKLSFTGPAQTAEQHEEIHKLVSWGATPQSHENTRPGLAVTFRAEGKFQNPMYEVQCDLPCVPTYLMYSVGESSSSHGIDRTPTEDPKVWIVGSGGMQLLTESYTVTIGVRSADAAALTNVKVVPHVE